MQEQLQIEIKLLSTAIDPYSLHSCNGGNYGNPEHFSVPRFPCKKQGKTWGSSMCPHCGQGEKHSNKLCIFTGSDGRERWFCHACGKCGDKADLVSLLEGITLRKALWKQKRQTTVSTTPVATRKAKAPPIPLPVTIFLHPGAGAGGCVLFDVVSLRVARPHPATRFFENSGYSSPPMAAVI